MFFNQEDVIASFYGMGKSLNDECAQAERALKVKELIKQMGDKYLLAKPVEKLNG
jgi:hypothetical protein